MHVGFAFRVEADTREEAYKIYSDLCDDGALCWEDNDEGMWDYCYGPKPLHDEPSVDPENTYWSDGNGTKVYNGITWEEFKELGIPPRKLNDMFEGFLIVTEDRRWDKVCASTFNSVPISGYDKKAWVFVTCSHI